MEVSLNLSITPYNRYDLKRIYRDATELDVNVRATSYMYPPSGSTASNSVAATG